MLRSLLPHLLTLSNLVMGVMAILHLLDGQPFVALGLVAGSMVADFLDGAAARALGVSSPLGKELDSLADMVSFGVFPGLVLYVLLQSGAPLTQWNWAAAPALMVPAFAAARLGRFNLDERQHTHFIGLATPAATIFVAGLLLIARDPVWGSGGIPEGVVYASIALLCYLLVSEVPMFSLKGLGQPGRVRYVLAGLVMIAIGLLIFAPAWTPAIVLLAYILANAGYYWTTGKPLAT